MKPDLMPHAVVDVVTSASADNRTNPPLPDDPPKHVNEAPQSPESALGHTRRAASGGAHRRPQLVLDIGNVLLTDLAPFWRELARLAKVPYEQIRTVYKREMSALLWDGRITEPEFWAWLHRGFPGIDDRAARDALTGSLAPLPALSRVPAWSALADVHVLSNHRAEWIVPALSSVRERFASMTISSEAGCSKPDAAIYAACAAKLKPGAPVIFVDDLPANLRQAEAIGWHTLLADEAGGWIDRVAPALRELSRPPLP